MHVFPIHSTLDFRYLAGLCSKVLTKSGPAFIHLFMPDNRCSLIISSARLICLVYIWKPLKVFIALRRVHIAPCCIVCGLVPKPVHKLLLPHAIFYQATHALACSFRALRYSAWACAWFNLSADSTSSSSTWITSTLPSQGLWVRSRSQIDDAVQTQEIEQNN